MLIKVKHFESENEEVRIFVLENFSRKNIIISE